MKIIYKIYYLTVVLGIVSCNKQLNVLPTTSRVDENSITDARTARTVLNGVYYQFANSGFDNNQIPVTNWYEVQQVIPSQLSGLLMMVGNPDDALMTHTYNSTNFQIEAFWQWAYKIQNAANAFLKNVEPVTIDAVQKREMMAEAKFLRAFSDATLLLYFGEYFDESSQYGIILRQTPVQSELLNLPRSGVAESYSSIIADLDAAIADLPEKSSKIIYANKAAARILKARLLICRGAGGDAEEVAALMQSVLDDGNYSLEPNLQSLFLDKGFASREVIMGIQPYASQSEVFKNYQFYNQNVATDQLVTLLADDPRKDWMVKQATHFYYGDIQTFTKYYGGDVNMIAAEPNAELGYAFRLTEAYLLRAEALSKIGTDLTEAKQLLKLVLNAAGITDVTAVDNASAAELHQLILNETMKNFAGEAGQDWLALRRLPLEVVQEMVPGIIDRSRFLLPVPQSELTENGEAVQTPGY